MLQEAAGLLEDFGRHKESQWKERGRDSYSVTSAGAFGMLFRGIFDFRVSSTALSLRPRLPRGVEKVEVDWPMGYGKQELWLSVSEGAGKRWEARVNGKRWATVEENARIEFPYEKLPARARITLRKMS